MLSNCISSSVASTCTLDAVPSGSGTFYTPRIVTWSLAASPSVNFNRVDTALNVFGYYENTATLAGGVITCFKVTPSGSGLAFRHAAPVPAGAASTPCRVYPNPASNWLTVINGTGASEASRYVITDIAGRTMLRGAVSGPGTGIDVSSLPPGTYIIGMYRDVYNCGVTRFIKE